ncbi:MAG: UvrD-helicase domain-containing protein, partial [Planctomycetota bacterium]
MTTPTPQLPDQADRDAAVRERDRNVVMEAGAGTGKTATTVTRIVHLVAPVTAGVAPLPIERLAAITFTRRAAGELRLRVRSALLRERQRAGSPHPPALLDAALDGIDDALIGTVHGFCDRLLRRRPMEAELSPRFEIITDSSRLADATLRRLLEGGAQGALDGMIGPAARARWGVDGARIDEATATVLDLIDAQVARASAGGPSRWTSRALDKMVTAMVTQRDVTPVLPPAGPVPDLDVLRRHVQTIIRAVEGLPENDDALAEATRRSLSALHYAAEARTPASLFGWFCLGCNRIPTDLPQPRPFNAQS